MRNIITLIELEILRPPIFFPHPSGDPKKHRTMLLTAKHYRKNGAIIRSDQYQLILWGELAKNAVFTLSPGNKIDVEAEPRVFTVNTPYNIKPTYRDETGTVRIAKVIPGEKQTAVSYHVLSISSNIHSKFIHEFRAKKSMSGKYGEPRAFLKGKGFVPLEEAGL